MKISELSNNMNESWKYIIEKEKCGSKYCIWYNTTYKALITLNDIVFTYI